MKKLLIVLLALFCLGFGPEQYPLHIERIIDGDTLVLRELGTVRLLGIDTPEVFGQGRLDQPCGQKASWYVRSLLLPGSTVGVEIDLKNGRDHYGRLLAYIWYPCTSGNYMLNERLVTLGYARVLTRWPFTRRPQLLRAQELARAAHRGLWNSRPCSSGRT